MESFTEQIKQSALKAAMVAQTTLATTNGFLDEMAATDTYVQSEGYNNNKHPPLMTATKTTNSNNKKNTNNSSVYNMGSEKNNLRQFVQQHPTPIEAQPSYSKMLLENDHHFNDDDGDDDDENDSSNALLATAPQDDTTQRPHHRPHRFMEDLEARLAQPLQENQDEVRSAAAPPSSSSQNSNPHPFTWFSNTVTSTMGISVPSLLPLTSIQSPPPPLPTKNTSAPPLSRPRNVRNSNSSDMKTPVEIVSSKTMLDPLEMEQLEQLRLLEHSSSTAATSRNICRMLLCLPITVVAGCCNHCWITTPCGGGHRPEIRWMILLAIVLGGGFMYFWLEWNIVSPPQNPLF